MVVTITTNSNSTHCDECGNKVQHVWKVLHGVHERMDDYVHCEMCNCIWFVDRNKFWKPWHSEEREVW